MSPWLRCLERLEAELPAENFYTWIKPLHADAREGGVSLLAPNAFVVETVRDEYLPRITELLRHYADDATLQVGLELGTPRSREREVAGPPASVAGAVRLQASGPQGKPITSNLDPTYTFDTFIEGSSNQLGRAAALQVAKDPGKAYNPLLLYGGTGLGKTHLMHAAGNYMLARNPGMRVLYLRSEQFFAALSLIHISQGIVR